MKIKEWVPAAPDRPRVKKSAELAVPKKPSDTGYACTPEYSPFRVQIELGIKTIQFRQHKHAGERQCQPPAGMDELRPILSYDPVQDKSAANGHQHKRALGHHVAGSQQGPGHQV